MHKFSIKPALSMLTISCALALGLSACQSAKEVFAVGEAAEKNPGPCPEAFALYETSRIVNFNGEESFSDVGFTAEIEKVRSLCRYYGENPINADLSIDIAFGRGPAAIGQTGVYNYYVAVTRKNIDVMNKEIFPVSITFPAGVDVVRATETIKEIIIPRANEGTSGANFEIIVGFELTPAQVAFNADGKRFRVSAGQD